MGDNKQKSKWDQLSLSQKAGLIKIYVDNGFSDIDSIREDYNKNVENFQSNDANFVQRLRNNDPKYVQNADGSVSTHKLNYATDDNGAIIYPSVQEHNGTLVDHSEDNMRGFESAIQQKDTVRTSIPFAEWYTQNYKKDYDEFFNRYNKFAGGGLIEGIKKAFAPNYNGTFNEAFRKARENGDSYFKWNGNRYSTEMKPSVLVKSKNIGIKGLTKSQLATMQSTWDYLRSHNISARNTAMVMGNMMQESSFNPTIVQKGGDNAVGYFQLHGKRLKDYRQYLSENKLKDSETTQLDYIIDVMRGKRGDYYMDEYNRVVNRINELKGQGKLKPWEDKELKELNKLYNTIYKSRVENNRLFPISDFSTAFEDESISLEDMTDLFTNTIERAGKPEYEKRRDYANKIYEYFYGKKVVQE